jgi:disulfide bond formation protein DsbB
VAVVATAGSLIYSGVIHFEPCRLCWYQRIAMYPLSVVLLVGAIRREVVVRFYALPLALGGALISAWHYLTQTFPSLEGGSCDPSNPCSAKYVDVFDFVSIPFMAGSGFIVIAVLLAFYVRTESE